MVGGGLAGAHAPEVVFVAMRRHRSPRGGSSPAAVVAVALLSLGPRVSAAPAPGPSARPWALSVPGLGQLETDLPPGWSVERREVDPIAATLRSTRGDHSALRIEITWGAVADPGFNGPDVVRQAVERQARSDLDRSVEGRYELRELAGPESRGYYVTLRDRAPRRRAETYETQGAVGVGAALVRFTFTSAEPDPPQLLQVLDLIAGLRVAAPAQRVEPPTIASPAAAAAEKRHGGTGGR